MNRKELRAVTADAKTRGAKAVIILLAVLIILITSYLPLKLFVIGSPRCDDIILSNVYASDTEIKISGMSENSAENFRAYSFFVKGGDAFFTINYVISRGEGGTGSFDIKKEGDFSKIERIYIKGEEKDRLIWEKGKQ